MKYDMKALAHDFWYGKPHQERRLGDLYIDKTGLYKHREWRGFKDTMYYFYNTGYTAHNTIKNITTALSRKVRYNSRFHTLNMDSSHDIHQNLHKY